jgi:hypothetical protein
VALDPTSLAYHVACIKQRMGPCDPTAQRYATMICEPEYTRFKKAERRAIIQEAKQAEEWSPTKVALTMGS